MNDEGPGGHVPPPVFTLGEHGGHTIVDRERSLGLERSARLARGSRSARGVRVHSVHTYTRVATGGRPAKIIWEDECRF